MKRWFDTKRRAHTIVQNQGDKVRDKLPWHVPKGHPRFSEPKEIKKQVGMNTFILPNRRKWHASQMALSSAGSKRVDVAD